MLTALKTELQCPVTHEPFEDPVVGSDGHTYERAVYNECLRRGLPSPLTREALRPAYPNLVLKRIQRILNDLEPPPPVSDVFLALRERNVPHCRRLLEHPALLNACEPKGRSVLYYAITYGHAALAAEIAANPRFTHASLPATRGRTPLHLAVAAGQPGTVRALLARKDVSVSPKDATGQTPLDLARQRDHADLILLLGERIHVAI